MDNLFLKDLLKLTHTTYLILCDEVQREDKTVNSELHEILNKKICSEGLIKIVVSVRKNPTGEVHARARVIV